MDNPRIDFLTELCAVFIEDHKEAIVKEYPVVKPFLTQLEDTATWVRNGKRPPNKQTDNEWKLTDSVSLMKANITGLDITVEIFVFGIGIEGMRITVIDPNAPPEIPESPLRRWKRAERAARTTKL